MRAPLIGACAAALITMLASTTGADARFYTPRLVGPDLVEDAACVVRRVRVVRPNGRVVYRTVRRCGPGIGPRFERCRVVRQRIVRPNGRVVVRSVRRCF